MVQGTGKADRQEVFSGETDPQPKLVPGKRWGIKKTVVLWCLPPKIVPIYFAEKKRSFKISSDAQNWIKNFRDKKKV